MKAEGDVEIEKYSDLIDSAKLKEWRDSCEPHNQAILNAQKKRLPNMHLVLLDIVRIIVKGREIAEASTGFSRDVVN